VNIEIQASGMVSVNWTVFTTAFRKVAHGTETFTNGGLFQWDLTDLSGKPVASGLYYMRLEIKTGTGSTQKILKILVIR